MSIDEIACSSPETREQHVGDTTIVDLNALAALSLLDLAPHLPSLDNEYSPIELTAVRAKLQYESLLKKYEHDNSTVADTAAFNKFLQVNESCGTWKLDISDEEGELLYGELRNTLYKFFYPLQAGDCVLSSFSQFLAEGYTGPGSSRGAKENDFYSKLFASPLTYTSTGLYAAYRRYIGSFEPWRDAEMYRYSIHGNEDSVVDSNKLCFVPKKVDISRCICVEPSLNMFYQLGIKQILEKRLKSFFGIDFSLQQEKNRDLAQLGSMFDKSFVTIDLSSASDSLSLSMLRKVIPSEPLGFLEALRSPRMELPPEMGGGKLDLNMISTMGNGYTFPLQTILFASVVISAYKVANLSIDLPRGKSLGNIGVYGDDIICEAQASRLVLKLLTLLGFSVNTDKSFFNGPFRESCGGDFWNGHFVRPVHIASLRSPQDLYVALNQLNRWTSMSGISLPLTVAFLRCHLKGKPFLVPPAEQDDAGLKVPRSYVADYLRCKWVNSIRYQRFEPRPSKVIITHCGIYKQQSSGKFREDVVFNPHGLWTAFLAGYIDGKQGRNGYPSITRRQRVPVYRRGWNVTPFWDYVPMSDIASDEWSYIAFEMACVSNEAAYKQLRQAG